MQFFSGLTRKKQSSSSASAERRKKEHDRYLKHGSALLEEFIALCDGNCRIPIRYFSATEIKKAIRHSENKMELSNLNMVTGSLNNRLVLIRFNKRSIGIHYRDIIHRDIAVTAQMSHLKNVLRLVGCCLEFEEPVMVYEYVEAITLDELLFNFNDHARKPLTWGNRLRVANEVASAILYLHTEFTTPIIHRNINPRKVIIDQNSGIAKIVDFSMSISLPRGELEVEDDVCGTIFYIDPEYANSGIVTQKADVYSFGILLFELLTGKKVRYIMNFEIKDANVMDRVDSAISKETIDFEEESESNIEEGNSMDGVNSAIIEETIDFEEDAESNIEEGDSMDRVNSTIQAETTDFENLPPNLINRYVKEGNITDIVDPAILEEHGIEIRQLEDYLDLVKKCTAMKGDYRPYMIHVARELRRIEKCFRALKIGPN